VHVGDVVEEPDGDWLESGDPLKPHVVAVTRGMWRLNSVGKQLGQKGWCFNGYASGRRWIRC